MYVKNVEKIVALEYIDAAFFYKKPKNWPRLSKHMVLGKRGHLAKDCIVIGFTETNCKIERGILIPIGAIMVANKQKVTKKLPENDSVVGVTWKDIVYFDYGNVPKKPTEVYSEGKLIYKNGEYIVLHNTETITISKNGVKNFPDTLKKPAYFVIPITLISNIEIYA